MRSKKVRAFIMKSAVVLSGILAYAMAVPSPSLAGTQWNVGISGGGDGIDGFHLSVGEYYRVPEREVVVIHKRGICDEDLPVVFFLAQRAHVHPDAVAGLRLRGMSWLNITLHLGLSPNIYYVHGRHGHGYDPHRHHDRRKSGIRDRDIREWVNTRFISEHHGYAPDRVIKYRSQGRSFIVIDRDMRKERHERIAHNGGKAPIYKKEGGNNDRYIDRNNGREGGQAGNQDRRRDNGRGR